MPDAPPPPARRRGGRVVRVLVPLLGLGLLAFLLHRTGWRDLEQAFRRIGWTTFALLVVLGAVEQVVDCEALRRAMLGRVGLAWTMASNAAGGLVNTVVPFEAGEVVKGALLRQRSTHSRVVSGLIVWNYVWKLAKPAAVATCFVLGVALGHVFRKDLQLPVLAGVVLSFVPYLGLRLLLRQRPAERLMRLLARVPRLKQRAQGGVQAAARLDGEVHSFWEHHPAAYLEVLVLTYAGRFVGVLALYLFARRLGLPTDLGSLRLPVFSAGGGRLRGDAAASPGRHDRGIGVPAVPGPGTGSGSCLGDGHHDQSKIAPGAGAAGDLGLPRRLSHRHIGRARRPAVTPDTPGRLDVGCGCLRRIESDLDVGKETNERNSL